MNVEYKILDQFERGVSVQVHDREVLGLEGKLALTLIEKWGMVLSVPDGEDTAGRQKLGLMPPSEVVARAFETARLATAKLYGRGLVTVLPSLDEAEAARKRNEERLGRKDHGR